MKVFVCDDCGAEYKLQEKPEKCSCGSSEAFIEMEKQSKDKCGNIFSHDNNENL